MRIQQLPVKCTKCEATFTADVVIDAPVDVFVASLRAVKCDCGGKSDSIVILTSEPEPGL